MHFLTKLLAAESNCVSKMFLLSPATNAKRRRGLVGVWKPAPTARITDLWWDSFPSQTTAFPSHGWTTGAALDCRERPTHTQTFLTVDVAGWAEPLRMFLALVCAFHSRMTAVKAARWAALHRRGSVPHKHNCNDEGTTAKTSKNPTCRSSVSLRLASTDSEEPTLQPHVSEALSRFAPTSPHSGLGDQVSSGLRQMRGQKTSG